MGVTVLDMARRRERCGAGGLGQDRQW
jgi:hypothetical protein